VGRVAAALIALLLAGSCSGAATPGPSGEGSGSPAVTSASPGSPTPVPTPAATASSSVVPTPGPTRTPEPTAPPAPTARWSELAPGDPRPVARQGHTWTLDAAGGVAYLFGGRDGDRSFDDLWTYDLGADAWTRLEPAGDGPPARFGHAAAWVDGVGLVVFAGQAGSRFFNDLWAYDPGAGAWSRLPSRGDRPVPRYGSCAALGPDGRLWISHGFTEDGTRFADTRSYDFVEGRWIDETPTGQRPVERCLHGCFWSADGRFVLFAGQTTGVEALDDLWALTVGGGEVPSRWERLRGTLPPARNLFGLARQAERVIVFGGGGKPRGTYLADAWLLDALTLEAAPIAEGDRAPSARRAGALIDDPAHGRLLLFGGEAEPGLLDDLWALATPETSG